VRRESEERHGVRRDFGACDAFREFVSEVEERREVFSFVFFCILLPLVLCALSFAGDGRRADCFLGHFGTGDAFLSLGLSIFMGFLFYSYYGWGREGYLVGRCCSVV